MELVDPGREGRNRKGGGTRKNRDRTVFIQIRLAKKCRSWTETNLGGGGKRGRLVGLTKNIITKGEGMGVIIVPLI